MPGGIGGSFSVDRANGAVVAVGVAVMVRSGIAVADAAVPVPEPSDRGIVGIAEVDGAGQVPREVHGRGRGHDPQLPPIGCSFRCVTGTGRTSRHRGQSGKSLRRVKQTGRTPSSTKCGQCTALNIPCIAFSKQIFKPLRCNHCNEKDLTCDFLPPFRRTPRMKLPKNCVECQMSHQKCSPGSSPNKCH